MISEHRFLKKSICLSIPEEDKRRFYAATVNIISELYKDPDWKKIFKEEERCQWPILAALDNAGLALYKEAEQKEVKDFINLILDEKRARLNLASDEKSYQKELERIIRERLKFLEKILEVSQSDIENLKKEAEKGKKWWLWLLGAVSIAGFCGVRQAVKKDKNNKSASRRRDAKQHKSG